MLKVPLPTAQTPVDRKALPLVAMEHYMLADDLPDFPMAIYICLHFAGSLRQPEFERALHIAIARHPLLYANIEPGRGRRRLWVWNAPPAPTVFWNDSPGPAQTYLDLASEQGVRARVTTSGNSITLLLQLHHSCCDGLGTLAFVEDLLADYRDEVARTKHTNTAKIASPPPHDNFPSDEALATLQRRARFGLTWLGKLLRLPLEFVGAVGTLEYFTHKPVPLTSETGRREPVPLAPDRLHHLFSVDDTKGLKQAAKADGATLNDLLIRDMFLAIGDWQEKHDPAQRGKHVRIMVPINLRTESDNGLPAANVVAMVNIDRRPRRWQNLRRMLRVLHWELAIVKRGRFGLTFIRALQTAHYVFNRLCWMLPRDKCLSTCVLTNLGDPWSRSRLVGPDGRLQAGDITLQRVEVMAPLRPHTHVSMGAFTYLGQLSLTLHFAPQAFSTEDAESLLAMFVSRLRRSIEGTLPDSHRAGPPSTS